MVEQVEKTITELKALQAKLPEVRDLFWLKIDRYDEDDQLRGEAFDKKFEQQQEKLCRALDSFTAFVEKSFTPSAEEIAKEKAIEKLRAEFSNFDEWNKAAKKALIDKEMNMVLDITSQKTVKPFSEELNRGSGGPKYQKNDQPDKIYSIDSDFSHCRPCLIEFRTKKYAVNNWTMMLKALAETLYNDNPTPIDEFVMEDLSKKPLFSKNPQSYLRALEIANELYVESNFSANQMCMFCKKLLDIYGIAHSEMKIYLDRIPAKI
jgi:hypothetical protein